MGRDKNQANGKEWGSGGLSKEKFLIHAPFEARKWLCRRQYPHINPILLVKIPNASSNEQASETFEEMF